MLDNQIQTILTVSYITGGNSEVETPYDIDTLKAKVRSALRESGYIEVECMQSLKTPKIINEVRVYNLKHESVVAISCLTCTW